LPHGQATWEAANGRLVLTSQDARSGPSQRLAHLDAGFYTCGISRCGLGLFRGRQRLQANRHL